jgi:hypothetical protein
MTDTNDESKIGHGKPGPGRPKSMKSKSERLFDKLMNSRGSHLERILDQVLALAEQGDTSMIRTIMDRVFPVKGRTIKGLRLSGADPAGAVDRVLKAVDDGDVTPDEAKSVLDVLRVRAELAESAEIEKRLAVLESAQ